MEIWHRDSEALVLQSESPSQMTASIPCLVFGVLLWGHYYDIGGVTSLVAAISSLLLGFILLAGRRFIRIDRAAKRMEVAWGLWKPIYVNETFLWDEKWTLAVEADSGIIKRSQNQFRLFVSDPSRTFALGTINGREGLVKIIWSIKALTDWTVEGYPGQWSEVVASSENLQPAWKGASNRISPPPGRIKHSIEENGIRLFWSTFGIDTWQDTFCQYLPGAVLIVWLGGTGMNNFVRTSGEKGLSAIVLALIVGGFSFHLYRFFGALTALKEEIFIDSEEIIIRRKTPLGATEIRMMHDEFLGLEIGPKDGVPTKSLLNYGPRKVLSLHWREKSFSLGLGLEEPELDWIFHTVKTCFPKTMR